MKITLLGFLILVSCAAFADETKPEAQAWEATSAQVSATQNDKKHDPWKAVADLEMSQPWHYGRQDSDAIVNRVRDDRDLGY